MKTNIAEIESMELPTVKNWKKEVEKWQIENSETSEISEKLFQVFNFGL